MNQATIDIEDPTADDLRHIYALINEFVKETGSVVGQNLINNWEEKCIKFIKIFPKDYKSALAELETERKQKAEAREHQQQLANQHLVNFYLTNF